MKKVSQKSASLLNQLNPKKGPLFAFLEPHEHQLLARLRKEILPFARHNAPVIYLRPPNKTDYAQLTDAGMLPCPLPPSLWDIQSQVGLYALAARHQARVIIFDLLNQALPWLEQRPNGELAEAARFLFQLHQRTGCVLMCLYMHAPWTTPAQRQRIEKTLARE